MRAPIARTVASAAAILLATSCRSAASSEAADPPTPKTTTIDFESMETSRAPAGFTPMVTGEGLPSSWSVSYDSSAPSGKKVLAQTSRDEVSFHFPLCIFDGLTARDVAVSVRWKTVGGRMNRSGGIVTRFQDPDHFYCVRFNSLEDNVNLYQYHTRGARRQITGSYHLRLTEEVWHTLRVELRGTRIRAWYDGALQFETDDASILAPGKVGLWTKSDSVTYFDDLVIESLDERGR